VSEQLPISISAASQSLEPGALITLFILDLAPLGLPNRWYFTPERDIVFGGQVYTAIEIDAQGFEWSGQGPMPQPQIRIANANRVMSGISALYKDLVGARLTRVRTYARFLDGQPDADPTAIYTAEIYSIEQKTGHDKTMIEWSLSAAMDQEGRKVPGRRVLRDLCMWRYRVWNPITGVFDYSKVQCPYTGNQYFDEKGNSTTAENDKCGRCISDCKLRFGANEVLPYGGFPGVARARY